MRTPASVSSGSVAIDELLGGLIPGDNVVWVGATTAVWDVVADRFLASSAAARPTVFVACSAADLRRSLPRGVDRLDATTNSRHHRSRPLADEIEAYLLAHPGCGVVVPGLDRLARRWGHGDAVAFFARTCPTMLQTGALTYWWLPSSLGPVVLDQLRQVTQVMLELRGEQLHVTKAESRPAIIVGSVHDLRLDDVRLDDPRLDDVLMADVPGPTSGPTADIHLQRNASAGRLARGLVAIRRDLNLSQAQLAQAAGVTPSAISQAESGARGLSVDTLLTIADRLGISVDRLLSARPHPGYVLARHDRSRTAVGQGVTALADDATVGLRAYFVLLDGGEHGEPPISHQGIELVAVVRGLVQISTGDDTPVLRAGDSLIATTAPITGWRNLRPDTAAFHWILRDETGRTPP